MPVVIETPRVTLVVGLGTAWRDWARQGLARQGRTQAEMLGVRIHDDSGGVN